MSVETNQIWNSIVNSYLLEESVCTTLRNKFESEISTAKPASATLANWLCEQKAISRFQANILLSNSECVFKYGNYVIVDLLSGPKPTGQYLARHIQSRHPVVLTFVGGNDHVALAHWIRVKSLSRSFNSSPHPNICSSFETVAIPEYRFLVTEKPQGVPIKARIPIKSRIQPENASTIIFQIANALDHLHSQGIYIGSEFEDQIWLSKSGLVQIPPFSLTNLAVSTNPNLELGNDIRQLALTWYRIVSGREPEFEKGAKEKNLSEFARLRKFHLTSETIRLIRSMISNEPSKRPNAEDVMKYCKRELGVDFDATRSSNQPLRTMSSYQDWLARTPAIITEANAIVDTHEKDFRFGDLALNPDLNSESAIESASSFELQNELPRASPKQLSGFRDWRTALLGSAIVVASLVGIVFALASTLSKHVRLPPDQHAHVQAQKQNQMEGASSSKFVPSELTNSKTNESVNIATPDATKHVANLLVDDDEQTLWESPTSGHPVDFAFVPPAPKIAVVMNASELTDVSEGKNLLKALGPGLNDRIIEIKNNVGFELPEIKQLLFTFHSNSEFSFETFFRFTLNHPIEPAALKQKWGAIDSKSVQGFEYFIRDNNNCFAITKLENQAVSQFIAGPEWLINESLELDGISAIAGSMKRLAEWSDHNRHLTIMFLRTGLFGDEGQKLMGESLAGLNRRASLAIDNFIHGICISLHLDQGTYLEFRFDQTVDLNPQQLQLQLRNRLKTAAKDITAYADNLSPNPYWDSARNRINGMAGDVSENLRIGIEEKDVICNGWFAPSAAHNWIAASELLLTFGRSQFVANSNQTQRVPQTLAELLKTPRDLSVSTSPDLTILLENLQQEIKDDYGALPFEFEIRLMGKDLSKQGITQNQRPSDFAIEQKPLADILTEIMVRANPDKNITSPKDLNCKMVWVTAKDPNDPTREIILVTTRVAVNERAYNLPDAFVPE